MFDTIGQYTQNICTFMSNKKILAVDINTDYKRVLSNADKRNT